MIEFVRDVVRLLIEPVDNYAFWVVVTAVLAVTGVFLATIGERLTRPIAVEVALRPERVFMWMPLSVVAVPLALIMLVLTVVGAGLAVIFVLTVPLFVGVAYCAVGELVGANILGRSGRAASSPQIAVVVGVVVMRLVKLVPIVGPLLELLILWFLMAAVCAVLKDVAWSAYKRRLPDEVQFEDDGVVEWNPPANEQSSEE